MPTAPQIMRTLKISVLLGRNIWRQHITGVNFASRGFAYNAGMLTVPEAGEEVLSQIRNVLKHVLKSRYATLYRKKFSKLELVRKFPHSLEEWRTLPILEREEVVSTPFWDRTYLPREDIMFYRHTSGTSGRKPLITPRNAFGDYTAALRLAGATRQISFLYGWYVTEGVRRSAGITSMNCFFPESVSDFQYIAALARKFKPDALLGYPSLLLLLAPYFEKAGVLKNIRILEVTGERCSEAQRKSLMRLYHNPLIFNQFGSTEAAGVYGGPCMKILERGSLGFHIADDYLLTEFIDPDTGKPADPREEPCETLLTSLTTDQPFPLIRYRTGDLLTTEKNPCPCGRGHVFFSEGRAQSDRIHFLDGVIAVKRLEEALAAHEQLVGIDYEAHYHEEECDDGVVRPRVTLHTVLKEEIDLRELADLIASRFMISAILSYKEASEQDFLLPLKVIPLPRRRPKEGKPKRLFNHTLKAS